MAALGDLLGRLDPENVRRGRQFARICQWFLTHDPVYAHELRRVWLWDEWPGCWGNVSLEYHHLLGVAEAGRAINEAGNIALACHWCHNLETQEQGRGRGAVTGAGTAGENTGLKTANRTPSRTEATMSSAHKPISMTLKMVRLPGLLRASRLSAANAATILSVQRYTTVSVGVPQVTRNLVRVFTQGTETGGQLMANQSRKDGRPVVKQPRGQTRSGRKR